MCICVSVYFLKKSWPYSRVLCIPSEVEEIQGADPQILFEGLAPQNHLTMVIVLPFAPFSLPPLANVMINN
jgi:hypothetical protein